MSNIADIKGWAAKRVHIAIEERNPNPCQRMSFINDETGDEIKVPCDGKHCPDCGPRKLELMQEQLKAGIGAYAYIETFDTRKQLDTTIERIRKESQRADDDRLYQAVGDDYLGYILVSNLPIHTDTRQKTISDWIDRISDHWKRGGRIRRSLRLGRLSRVSYRTVEKVGTSSWKWVSHASKTAREHRLEAEIARRDALIDDIGGWHVWEEGKRWVSSISAWRIDGE